MAGRLEVTTNKQTYAPYASIDTGDDLTIVVEDGDSLEITITNSQADRDSASPLQYFYVSEGDYYVRADLISRLDFKEGYGFNILPDGQRVPADPRSKTVTIPIPSDFSARTTQFGVSIGIEAWPFPRKNPVAGWLWSRDRVRQRIWVFSATAPMPTLSPTLTYLPLKIREEWVAGVNQAGLDRFDYPGSAFIRARVPGVSKPGPWIRGQFSTDYLFNILAEWIADPELGGGNFVQFPLISERDIDTIQYSLPGADAPLNAALAALQARLRARGTSTFWSGTTEGAGDPPDIDMMLWQAEAGINIWMGEAGYERLGSDPTLRFSLQRLGRTLDAVDMPIRIVPIGATIPITATTAPYESSGYRVSQSVTVPIGGRAPITITLPEPATEDVVFAVTLSDGATVELSTAEATIKEGATSVTFYVEDNSDTGTEQTATVTITPPDNLPLTVTTVDVSVRQETPGLVPTPATLYTIDGLIQSTDDPDSVGYEMDASWGGESVFKDGAWHYLPGHARAPVAHISPADILAYDLRQIGPDAQDRINAASMSIAQNKDGDYLPFRLDTQVLEDALSVDGTPYEADLGTRGFITDSVHARQALSIALRRTRYPTLTALRISPGAKLERLAIHPGDIVTYTDARYGVYGERNRVMSSTVHPDLSMTLSLRGEPVTTYDPALPYLPPAAPTEPLWRRLFKVPDGVESRDILAVAGDSIFMQGPDPDGGSYSIVELSTAGVVQQGTVTEYSERGHNLAAIAAYEENGRIGLVGLHTRTTIGWLFDIYAGNKRWSNWLRGDNDVWPTENLSIRHGPGAQSASRRVGLVFGDDTTQGFSFRFGVADFTKFVEGQDGARGPQLAGETSRNARIANEPAGAATVGAVSQTTGDTRNDVLTMIERLDGTFLTAFNVISEAERGGFRVMSSSGSLSQTAAFTFQGVGDEDGDASINAMCIAPDGRLYCNMRTTLGDSRDDYIYVRRNATEPDEERE